MRHRVGLIGEGIGASLTPALHEAEGRSLGMDYEYHLFDLIDPAYAGTGLAAVLTDAGSRGFSAVNVTHPFKQRVLDLVDTLDEDAAALRAVNLIVFDRGRRVGYNTDWSGFGAGLAGGLPGASLDHVVQIGCGGAGAATAYALLAGGAGRLDLVDADADKADDLVARMTAHFPDRRISAVAPDESAHSLAHASGVVHATPLGMAHHPGVAFDVELLPAGAWVADIVYRPLETELLRHAARRGHAVLDGGRMAVGQAYASLRIITGEEPDLDRMQRHFAMLIRAEARQAGTVGHDRTVG